MPCLASAMVSLYITLYRPFISSQRDRSDVIIKVQNDVDYNKCSINKVLWDQGVKKRGPNQLRTTTLKRRAL